jgi:hypothetical protein
VVVARSDPGRLALLDSPGSYRTRKANETTARTMRYAIDVDFSSAAAATRLAALAGGDCDVLVVALCRFEQVLDHRPSAIVAERAARLLHDAVDVCRAAQATSSHGWNV